MSKTTAMKNTNTGKIKTEWDLSPLYASVDDPKIDADIKKAEKAYTAFERKYKTSLAYMKSETALVGALGDFEKLMDLPMSRTYSYLHFVQDLDTGNEKIRARGNLVRERLQKLNNKIVFFEVNLSKIPKPLQKKLLASKKIARYQYFLKKIFDNAKYILTEAEEKILSLKSLPSHTLWTQSTEKIRDSLSIEVEGKKISLFEARMKVIEMRDRDARTALHIEIMEKLKAISHIAESELNAIVIDKKIDDELRGYTEPYDATIVGYQNNRKSVLNLVKTVTDNFGVAHRFYKLKAKMLGLDKLLYSDKSAPVGNVQKKITFEESYHLLHNLFTNLDPEFGAILKRFVENGQIDVYPRVGKRGGAYCAPGHKMQTYVFMNYTDSLHSLETFAHEMGHAIHTEYAKSQPVLYSDYSISTAEVASTLFELFAFYASFEKMTDEEKVTALHDKIQSDLLTIFTQIAGFNFELDMHNTIRAKGSMSKEELAVMMNKHMHSSLGPVVEMSERDGYGFVSWLHLRWFFYVYTYAMGQLASMVLYKKYSEDKSYMEKIKKFMSLGGSMSPEDIFKSIGVDISRPDFFKKGIESIEADIVLLEKLVNKK